MRFLPVHVSRGMLQKGILQRGIFQKVYFNGVCFKGVYFRGDYFRWVYFKGVYFKEVYFKGVYFKGVYFRGVYFRGYISEDAFQSKNGVLASPDQKWSYDSIFRVYFIMRLWSAPLLDLEGAAPAALLGPGSLANCLFYSHSRMLASPAHISRGIFQRGIFQRGIFHKGIFQGVYFRGVYFRGVHFKGVYFKGAYCRDAYFRGSEESRRGVGFPRCSLCLLAAMLARQRQQVPQARLRRQQGHQPPQASRQSSA